MNDAQHLPASWTALAARQILQAVDSGDVARLEAELSRVAEGRLGPGLAAERLELLEAVAEGLLGALRRIRQGLSDDLEGASAQLRLLHHLAEFG